MSFRYKDKGTLAALASLASDVIELALSVGVKQRLPRQAAPGWQIHQSARIERANADNMAGLHSSQTKSQAHNEIAAGQVRCIPLFVKMRLRRLIRHSNPRASTIRQPAG